MRLRHLTLLGNGTRVTSSAGIDHVDFYLDDLTRSGTPFHTDSAATYDLTIDLDEIGIGEHTLQTVTVYTDDRADEVGQLATFDVLAAPAPTGPQVYEVTSISASAHDGNVPQNAVDGDLTTYWGADGDGQWLRADIGSVQTVGSVRLAWHLGDQRNYLFDVQVSGSSAGPWTTIYLGRSDGLTLNYVRHRFPEVNARFVRILGHGNTASTYNAVTQLQAWSGDDVLAPPGSATIAAEAGIGQVTLSWTPGYGPVPSSYNLWRADVQAGPYDHAVVQGTTSLSAVDSNVANGATYWYRVDAISGDGAAGSNEVSAGPLPQSEDQPPLVYGTTRDSYTNGTTLPLDGAALETGSVWVFADTTDMDTSTIERIRLIDQADGTILWNEVTPPYGDPSTSLNLADGDYVFYATVTYNDGRVVNGPTATFSVTGPPPPTGGDLSSGFDRATLLNERWGFGRFAGGTNDGSADDAMTWPEVVVSDASNLAGAIAEQRWVTFTPGLTQTASFNFTGSHGRFVIDGRGANVTLKAGGNSDGLQLDAESNSNVIVAYLNWEAPGHSHDSIRVAERAHDIWIHKQRVIGGGSADGSFDITRGATDVTVDYVHISNWTKTFLWGGDDVNDSKAAEGNMRISARDIWFQNCEDRQPRMRYSYVHLVNCLWESANYAAVSSQDAKLLCEGCVWDDGAQPGIVISKFSSDTTGGSARSEGHLLLNGATINTGGTVDNPPYAGTYTVDVADQALIDFIKANAGNV